MIPRCSMCRRVRWFGRRSIAPHLCRKCDGRCADTLVAMYQGSQSGTAPFTTDWLDQGVVRVLWRAGLIDFVPSPMHN